MSPENAMDIGVHRIRDRIRVTSRVVPSGLVSSCHTHEVSPGVFHTIE